MMLMNFERKLSIPSLFALSQMSELPRWIRYLKNYLIDNLFQCDLTLLLVVFRYFFIDIRIINSIQYFVKLLFI